MSTCCFGGWVRLLVGRRKAAAAAADEWATATVPRCQGFIVEAA